MTQLTDMKALLDQIGTQVDGITIDNRTVSLDIYARLERLERLVVLAGRVLYAAAQRIGMT